MTRLLYWNISEFEFNRICPQGGDAHVQDQVDYILQVMTVSNPQMIVIVEVKSEFGGGRGFLNEDGGGAAGCELLMAYMASLPNGSDWRLVPPIQTGDDEAVAVFYDQGKFIFTGPNIWEGASKRTGNTTEYATPFKDLVGRRVIPNGASHNTGRSEHACAARVAGFDRPDDACWKTTSGRPTRSPYLVTFAGLGTLNNVVANLSIVAVHAPSKGGPDEKENYITLLAQVPEITGPLGNDEIRIVVGDFNLNSANRKDTGQVQYNTKYDPLGAPPACLEILMKADGRKQDDNGGYMSLFTTRLKALKQQPTYWSGAKLKNTYPGYAYTLGEVCSSPDNAFLAHGAGVNVAKSLTIINPIVGSPYNVFPFAPPNPSIGTVSFPRCSAVPVDLKQSAPKYTQGQAETKDSFTTWHNYERFYTTSDHLPLVIEF